MRVSRKGWKDRDRVEKLLILCAVMLALALCAALIFAGRLLFSDNGPSSGQTPLVQASPTPAVLATPEDRLPVYLRVGQEAPKAVFQEEDGTEVHLDSLQTEGSRGLWLVFWASWCPDCTEQFQIIRDMERLAQEEQVDLVLIDRLNPQKESREKAREKLKDLGVSARCVYDVDEVCYKAWGMKEIPSAVMLDGRQTVREYHVGVMTAGQCAGMLSRFVNGRDSAGRTFIQNRFMNESGGIMTSTGAGGASPSGADVLSESQGLMLLYALEKDDRALFDQTWGYVRDHLLVNGIPAWYAGEKGPAGVNALLDDLRIWSALDEAGRRWDARYTASAKTLLDALSSSCVNKNGQLVDFVEFESGRQAATLTLCYIDLKSLEAMAKESSALTTPLESAREILQNGRISDAFPLYYCRWDYEKKTYSQDSLNTAEALYTLWNLSRAKALPSDALAWLRARVETATLAARYRVDGTAVPGYEYHSTAVYGLAALIAREENDPALFETALRRMERMSCLDKNDAMFGAYCQQGAEAYAFDQLIPLLVNATLSGRMES